MHLDAKTLYYLACRDVLKDSQIDAEEGRVLTELRKVLALSDEDVAEVKDLAVKGGSLEGAPSDPMDARKLFQACCRVAWADGVMELSEATQLTDLSEVLGIPYDDATADFEAAKPAGA